MKFLSIFYLFFLIFKLLYFKLILENFDPLPMVYRPRLPMEYRPPLPMYIDPPTYDILTPLPMVF